MFKKFLSVVTNAGLFAVGVFDDLHNCYEGSNVTRGQFWRYRPLTQNAVEGVRHYLKKNTLFSAPTVHSLALTVREIAALRGETLEAKNPEVTVEKVMAGYADALHGVVVSWLNEVEKSLVAGDKSLVTQYRHIEPVAKQFALYVATLEAQFEHKPSAKSRVEVSLISEEDLQRLHSNIQQGLFRVIGGVFNKHEPNN